MLATTLNVPAISRFVIPNVVVFTTMYSINSPPMYAIPTLSNAVVLATLIVVSVRLSEDVNVVSFDSNNAYAFTYPL